MINRVNVGEWYECELYKREPDTNKYSKFPIRFNAKVFTPKETMAHEPLNGSLSSTSMIAIRTSAMIDFDYKDKVKILDEEYLIVRIAVDLQQNYGLGASRFSPNYLKQRSEKLIYLQ